MWVADATLNEIYDAYFDWVFCNIWECAINIKCHHGRVGKWKLKRLQQNAQGDKYGQATQQKWWLETPYRGGFYQYFSKQI